MNTAAREAQDGDKGGKCRELQSSGCPILPNALRFVLNLPDDWNGRFMFQGGSAYNGSIGEPRGLGVGGLDDPALAHGWAIIATDSGHKGAPFDTTFMRDQHCLFRLSRCEKIISELKHIER